MKNFLDIVAIARDNIRSNPDIVTNDAVSVAKRYLQGLMDEVREVEAEVKENNEVYLTDELSDIAWDYAVLLALLEERGFITNIESVIEHAHDKYTKRSEAFCRDDATLWDEIKQTQKQQLETRHKDKYGDT